MNSNWTDKLNDKNIKAPLRIFLNLLTLLFFLMEFVNTGHFSATQHLANPEKIEKSQIIHPHQVSNLCQIII